MAINTTRLSTRLGHIFAGLNELNTYRGTTLVSRVTTVAGDYATVNPSLISDIYAQQSSTIASLNGFVGYLGSLVSGVIVDEVLNDKAIPNPSLQVCLVEWVRQMKVAVDSFQASPCTLGSVTAVGSPTSAPQFIKTAKDGTGVVQDLIIPDSYLLAIASDDQRGATTYSEPYTLEGKAADPANTDYTYAIGAGLNTQKRLLDPASSLGIVTNSGFDTFTVANTPDGWTLTGGTAGTNFFKVSDDPRTGAAGTCIRFLSTGSGSLKLRQDITARVKPNTVYGVHFKQKPVANGSATTSTLIVTARLVDGAGSVIADDASTNNTLAGSAHSVVTIGSGWNSGYQSVFITPGTLPAIVYFELVQAADNSGADDYVDHATLVELTPLYAGGPYLEAFSGKVRAVEGDAWTWAITLSSGSLSGYMIREMDRFLDLKSMGIRVPTAGSPTQSDGLIT